MSPEEAARAVRTKRAGGLRLAPRLGLAVVVALAATFLLDQILRTLIPPPPFLLLQRAWLVESVADAARGHEKGVVPAGSKYLAFSAGAAAPFAADAVPSQLSAGLAADIARALGRPVGDVRVRAEPYSMNFWEQSARTAAAIVPDLPAMMTAEQLASSESHVLGTLDIAVRLGDGRWLLVSPQSLTDPWRHYARSLLGLGGNGLIILLFSFWMARSIIAPLSRLAGAAERLGREREPTLITGMRLPEYVAIADTFNAMQIRLKHYIDERVQMLAAISHDLRTPLTRLRLLAEYVGEAEQRDQLRSNVAEMETMVADALALMREEARHEPRETVDLAALLISLADTYNDLGEDVVYEGPDHFDMACHPVAMKRAFANLVANGCKYGEAVRIRLVAQPGAVIVDVRDRGPGIAAEDSERAFAPFARLESSRSRETGGSGLGLAISRDVIRGHGGEIGFHGRKGDFTVRVILPTRPDDAVPYPAAISAAG